MRFRSRVMFGAIVLTLAAGATRLPLGGWFGRLAMADEVIGAEPNAPRWSSLGGDYRRTGLSRVQGPTGGCVEWQFETDGAVVGSPTVGADGRIHIASEGGTLYTLAADGTVLWAFDANTPLLSAPSIGPHGGLYVGGQDGALYAVDPNGRLEWLYETDGAIYSSPAVAPSGAIYVGSTDGTLYALGPDGAELWRFTTRGPGILPAGAIFASPAIGADGTVYIGGLYDPNLYALDPSYGRVKWACSFRSALWHSDDEGGWPFASPVIAPDGIIYQTLLYDSRLYAIEPAGGTILWATDLLDPSDLGEAEDVESGSGGWSEPVLGPDGTIYVSLDDPYLRAVEPEGALKWVAWLGQIGAFALTVDKNDLIYAAGDDGYVHLVDPYGEGVTRFEVGGWPAFPVIADEDTLLVADSRDYSILTEGPANIVKAISSNCPEGAEPITREPEVPPPPPEPSTPSPPRR